MSVSTETTVADRRLRLQLDARGASAVEAEASHLTQLDSAIGDGDHGVNMTRGFRAVIEKLDGATEPPGKQLITAGKTLVSTVGGASGPLWGTALRRAGRAVGDAPALDGPALADALDAALAGVVELGAAEPGDKTMVDALGPAVAGAARRRRGGRDARRGDRRGGGRRGGGRALDGADAGAQGPRVVPRRALRSATRIRVRPRRR